MKSFLLSKIGMIVDCRFEVLVEAGICAGFEGRRLQVEQMQRDSCLEAARPEVR